jgi:predicted ATPase/DNA-binding NarL/FixJ family response regulator
MATSRRAAIGNLPAETSSFVGRRRDSGEVRRLLTGFRLVTVTGVGGVGKTRLALRAAGDVRRVFPDGVWFVDLTTVPAAGPLAPGAQDPDVLADLVRAALGLHERGRPSVARLTSQLAGRRMLLVIDNCEHLISACAVLIDALLRGCPRLRVLATSREPLLVAGEALFVVAPLPTPDPGRRADLAEVAGCEAVALFVDRGQAAAAGFALTEGNRAAVAALCRSLDGLPLAIELAAARLRSLAPEQILDRLDDRFVLLGRGARPVPSRQQTLRACVDWSFLLCTKAEQTLWARLSVFAGGCELDAIETVCADGLLPEPDLLDVVAGLVNKSILVVDNVGGQAARFRMLETLREFGHAQLVAAGEAGELRRRHRDWCQRLTERADAEWVSDGQAYWLDRLDREHPNLRAAMEYNLTAPDGAEAAARLAVTLPRTYWMARGLTGEARSWLERTLTQDGTPTALRARALSFTAYYALFQGDVEVAGQLLEQGQDLAHRWEATAELAHLAYVRGLAAMFRNDLSTAIASLERTLALAAALPQPDLQLRLNTLICLGTVAGITGDQPRAEACCQQMLAITEPRGEIYYRSLALWVAALTARRQGNLTEALTQARQSLRLRRTRRTQATNDRYATAVCLELLAWIAADQSEHRRAATLLGAAGILWNELGATVTAFQHLADDHDACQRQTRQALGDAAYADALTHGQTLPVEAALGYALDEHPRPRALVPSPPAAPTPLTRRERQVAALVAQGLSNKDIASRLVIGQRTAESHVQHILTKLDVTNRAQVATWVAAQQFTDSDT